MIFGYFTLLVALAISAVAEFYSIVGLMAIFAAAPIPAAIMGATLGVGKITGAVWLKLNWHRASWTYKVYLIPAVVTLMFLTSMGIFGFLSKAHSDQSLVSGDVVAKISIYDEKIKTEKENIDANRKALKQLDEAVDQVMGRSTSETGADKAVAIRRAQQKERSRLQSEIAESQKRVASLNEERAPIAAEVRKVEAEVGPIKYIAALVYGDNPDANLLEAAVRWVIILIVAVFDPLALVLILAAQQSLRWGKEVSSQDLLPQSGASGIVTDTVDDQIDKIEQMSVEATSQQADDSILKQHPYLTQGFSHFGDIKPMVYKPEEPKVEIFAGNPEDFKKEWSEEEKQRLVGVMEKFFTKESNDPHPVGWMFPDKTPKVKKTRKKKLKTKEVSSPNAPGLDASVERPGDYITSPEEIGAHYIPDSGYIHHDGKSYSIESFKAQFPELAAIADSHPILEPVIKASFGNEFPLKPDKGDMFLRTDFLPSRQYKFNGSKWIEVEKSTDVLAYDEQYIKHLVDKITTGEYDVEELSETEQAQVAEYLKKSVT